ncbi:MAG: nucleotide exchange factor GrpE [Deltaproteobacteria bacterium]|nr:nucleotide exchange factor GrpE [Deltaproteobacteria bacterium]
MSAKRKKTPDIQNDADHDDESTQTSAETEQEAPEDQETSTDSLDSLGQELQRAEQETEELKDRLLRTMAEFDNYKKRVTREKDNLVKYGTEKLALDILPVIDNFERALEQAKEATEMSAVTEGLEMIFKQFADVLEKFNITAFASLGEIFDPEKHEAMAQQEHEEHEDNTVINEFQKGYCLNDRLLRPARVIVSKRPQPVSEPEDSDEADPEEA